jgi:hypothetical protein
MGRLFFLVGALTASSLAWAQESAPACRQWPAPGLEEGPVAMGFYDADTVSARRACPRTEVSLGARLDATIDSPDFFGAIGGTALLSASYAQTETRELFVTLEALRYDYIQNAVIKQSEFGLGQLTVGASQIVAQGGSWATATSARLMLPTSTLSDVSVFGLDVGQALTFRLRDTVELHGFAGADGSAAAFAAPQPLFGALITAGMQYSPGSRFGLVLDLNGRLGGRASYVAPAVALRFRAATSVGFDVAASRPLIGTDRPNAVLGIRMSIRGD